MKLIKLIIIIFYVSYSLGRRRTKGKTIPEVREEAKKCKTLYCLGEKAYSLRTMVTVEYIQDSTIFAQKLQEDYKLRGNEKTICEICIENDKNGYHGFTSIDNKVVMLGEKNENDKRLPFSVLHELTHILCGDGGISNNLNSGTNSFNEALVNDIASNFEEKNPLLISKEGKNLAYPLTTKPLDDLIKVFDIEDKIPIILFEDNYDIKIYNEKSKQCLDKINSRDNANPIVNYYKTEQNCNKGYSSRQFIYFMSFVFEKLMIFIEEFHIPIEPKFNIFEHHIYNFERFFEQKSPYTRLPIEIASKIVSFTRNMN